MYYISPSLMRELIPSYLKRLQSEGDPCVAFDPNKKLWIYRHRLGIYFTSYMAIFLEEIICYNTVFCLLSTQIPPPP